MEWRRVRVLSAWSCRDVGSFVVTAGASPDIGMGKTSCTSVPSLMCDVLTAYVPLAVMSSFPRGLERCRQPFHVASGTVQGFHRAGIGLDASDDRARAQAGFGQESRS